MNNARAIERGESLSDLPVISDKLAQYITPQQILANVANFPEMQRELDGRDALIVERVKAAMMRLPLVYSTHRDKDQIMSRGILPFSRKPSAFYGNSMPLDESLGLTDYTFYNWGIVEKSIGHGPNHALLSAELLFDPRTIVTPNDISRYVYSQDPYNELDESKKGVIQEQYLGRVLAGRDWVEVMSRKVYFALKGGNTRVLFMGSDCTLGEVKILGIVPSSEVWSFLLPINERDYWAWQIKNGFLPGPVGRAMEPYSSSSYDPKPEELGVTLDEMMGYWDNIFIGEEVATPV